MSRFQRRRDGKRKRKKKEKNKYTTNSEKIYIILHKVSGMGQSYREIVRLYNNQRDFQEGIRENYEKYRDALLKQTTSRNC